MTLDLEAFIASLAEDGSEVYAGIGSRDTPQDVLDDMTLIARGLEKIGFILGSGGAGGADLAFEKGVTDPSMKRIFLPWKGFNRSTSQLYPRDPAVKKEAYALAARFHPFWEGMVAKATTTKTDEYSLKAAKKAQSSMDLHARNGYQVLGEDLKSPVRFVVCWTVDGSDTGGTGQAIRIAWDAGIPVLNLFFEDHRALLVGLAKQALAA